MKPINSKPFSYTLSPEEFFVTSPLETNALGFRPIILRKLTFIKVARKVAGLVSIKDIYKAHDYLIIYVIEFVVKGFTRKENITQYWKHLLSNPNRCTLTMCMVIKIQEISIPLLSTSKVNFDNTFKILFVVLSLYS